MPDAENLMRRKQLVWLSRTHRRCLQATDNVQAAPQEPARAVGEHFRLQPLQCRLAALATRAVRDRAGQARDRTHTDSLNVTLDSTLYCLLHAAAEFGPCALLAGSGLTASGHVVKKAMHYFTLTGTLPLCPVPATCWMCSTPTLHYLLQLASLGCHAGTQPVVPLLPPDPPATALRHSPPPSCISSAQAAPGFMLFHVQEYMPSGPRCSLVTRSIGCYICD